MPTGYTAGVKDGEETFESFVWKCARAFGALILMRDQSIDASIPQKFEPDGYYTKALAEAKRELAEAQRMSDDEAQYQADVEYSRQMQEREKAKWARETDLERYNNMIARVEAWEPPSSDHVELKRFMLEQLRTSIEHDCSGDVYPGEPERATGAEWRQKRLAQLQDDVAYYKLKLGQEEERCRERTEWVQALNKSVPCPNMKEE